MARVDGLHVEVADLAGHRDRRALVLLHEGLGSVGLWRAFPRALQEATGRRVIAFSRFGHGRSDRPRAARTPAFFHEEAHGVLPALLGQLDAPEPLLVGHSDGASIALVHAARHPVSGLALMAPHVVLEESMIEPIRATRREFEAGELRARMTRHHDDPDAAVPRLVRRVAGSRDARLEPRGRRRGGLGADAAHPGRRRPVREPRSARPHRGRACAVR